MSQLESHGMESRVYRSNIKLALYSLAGLLAYFKMIVKARKAGKS
jgi:hypothetical protein